MEIFVLIFKTIAILFSGIFGLLGAVNSFRDTNEKITRIGAISIMGIVLSIFLALVAQGIEHILNKKADEITRKQTSLLQQKLDDANIKLQVMTAELESAGKTINVANLKIDNLKENLGKPVIPIKNVLFYGYYVVNLNATGLRKYFEILDARISQFSSSQGVFNLCKYDDAYEFYIDNNPLNGDINKKITNGDIHLLMKTLWITTERVNLSFYRQYNEDRIFLPFAGGGTGYEEKIKFNPDLRVPTTIQSKTCFLYFPHSKKILLGLEGRSVDEKITYYTGNLTSTVELPLSTMFMSFPGHYFAGDNHSESKYQEIYESLKKAAQIDHLHIQIGSYSLNLNNDNPEITLEKYQSNSWKYTFPQDIYSLSTTSISRDIATESYLDMIRSQSDTR